MSHQDSPRITDALAGAGEQIDGLRAILAVVRSLDGEGNRAPQPAALADPDRLYAAASPLARHRFDALAHETAAFAAAGLSALIAGRAHGNSGAAAAALAHAMDRAIRRMERMLGQG